MQINAYNPSSGIDRCIPGASVACLALGALLCATVSAHAASMEIWPSERRANNTFYCYGDDWNWLPIMIYPHDMGKHVVDLPPKFAQDAVLQLSLPDNIGVLDINTMTDPGNRQLAPWEIISKDGRQILTLTLDNDSLNQRLTQNNYWYRIYLWFSAPAELNDILQWRFTYGDRLLAEGTTRLVTAGVVSGERPLPEQFRFYPYGSHVELAMHVPEGDYDRIADFYRRFGIAGIESHWVYGKPIEAHARHQRWYEANRRHGVKNIANMTLFAYKHGDGWMAREAYAQPYGGGLTQLMDAVCAGISSDEAIADWQAAHEVFDMAFWDWEPKGPREWPGFDDTVTAKAFAREHGLDDTPSAEALATTYRNAYERFRMEQIARPIYAMRDMIDRVNPIPFRIEQGSGPAPHIHYDIYGHDFDALSPMIYEPSPVRYARALIETLAGTTVPAKKFWPDLTIGWHTAQVFRESPEAYLLDTLVTAAAGCGSLAHWPGIHQADAAWWGIHEGLVRIAKVEEFYFEGTPDESVRARGIPYRSESFDVGGASLSHETPDWRASLITFAHAFEGESLFTLLNYHPHENAFVRIELPDNDLIYLVDPVHEIYTTADKGGALIEVSAESPALWIATADKARIEGKTHIPQAVTRENFTVARDAFLASSKQGDVALGTNGAITVNYNPSHFGGNDQVALKVDTPAQTVEFSASGGRVTDWRTPGLDSFVARDHFATDGMFKDLLWLPEGARWSGDETADYQLTSVANNGREAEIIYEGRFDSGLPGVRITKTYRIPADEAKIRLQVRIDNGRVDEDPVKLSYWSHSVFNAGNPSMVTPEWEYASNPGDVTVASNENLSAGALSAPSVPGKHIGSTGPVYAEFFPQDAFALVFRLPDDFMTIHRWSGSAGTKTSSEWMSQTLSILPGGSEILDFTAAIIAQTNSGELRTVLEQKPAHGADPSNLIQHDFSAINDSGLPRGWRATFRGENRDTSSVFATHEADGAAVVLIDMPEESTVFFDSIEPIQLQPEDSYVFIVQLSVENMSHDANWYGKPAGIRLYIYGDNGAHTWMAVHGTGSTDGWVTAALPFPRDNEQREQFGQVRVMLRCLNMSGIVEFRDPVIQRLRGGVMSEPFFETAAGLKVMGGQLRLTP